MYPSDAASSDASGMMQQRPRSAQTLGSEAGPPHSPDGEAVVLELVLNVSDGLAVSESDGVDDAVTDGVLDAVRLVESVAVRDGVLLAAVHRMSVRKYG